MNIDSEFEKRIAALTGISFREDFEAALYDLYQAATPAQRAAIRQATKAGSLQPPKHWRNPTDYNRADLTREKRQRQRLVAMSISEGGVDYRDDLMSIAYCYHNLKLMGIDADQVLEELAQLSGPHFANLVLGFVRRSPDQKSLKAFGLEIEQTPAGPVAERRSF